MLERGTDGFGVTSWHISPGCAVWEWIRHIDSSLETCRHTDNYRKIQIDMDRKLLVVPAPFQ